MTSDEIRQKYLNFFEKNGHKIVPSSSLLPNDPSVLLTTAGMQPMAPYLLGKEHFLGKRIVDSQKCFRAQDIEEVGDNRHTTFFEMLGNWSFGDYFKKEQIQWIFDFLINEINLNPKNLYVTVFRGNDNLNISRDNESVKIWQEVFLKVGIEAKVVDLSEQNGMQCGRIFYYNETKNWWSRSGVPSKMPIGEFGGPCSEMFWDFGEELKIHEKSQFRNQPCHVNCDCGRFLEIGNNVFMEYIKTEKGFDLLPNKNVDFGGGLERIIAVENNVIDVFETDLFKLLILKIKELSPELEKRILRILADHLRASIFLIADGVRPSNKEAGYILRRLLRRILAYQIKYNIHKDLFLESVKIISEKFQKNYPELKNIKIILEVLEGEAKKFQQAVSRGIKEIEKYTSVNLPQIKEITAEKAFYFYETFGLSFELIKELAPSEAIKNLSKDDFDKFFEKHQEISKIGSEQKFKGGLASTGEMEIKYHTATHLLLASLRRILGNEIMQKGSNITFERMRFDFNWPEKVNSEQLKNIEDLVNQKINEKIPVEMLELPKEEAKKIVKNLSFDLSKYGDIVKVYKINDFSIEFCGGPHVKNTFELGHFKIIKEEASSAGVRRIKGIIE